MIREVYEVDPMVRPQCGGTMKIIAFLTDYSVVGGIVFGLKLGTYPVYFLTRSGTKTFH